jgi:hypothetical protein
MDANIVRTRGAAGVLGPGSIPDGAASLVAAIGGAVMTASLARRSRPAVLDSRRCRPSRFLSTLMAARPCQGGAPSWLGLARSRSAGTARVQFSR